MSPKLTDRAIRAMPYESRVRRYNQDKNDLYRNFPDRSVEWLETERKKLEKKWLV